MKAREIYESVRQQKNRLSLRVRMTLLVSAELLVCELLALACYVLLQDIVPINPNLLLFINLAVISLGVGSVVTSFMAKHFFSPVKKLQAAMKKVADGDFSVQLEDQSSYKEIMEIYSGFNLMTQELAATEILQTDFVSNVSHEFKTPINAIEGYAMLLQDSDNLTPDQQRYVDKIGFNTSRLSSLVGSILLLSKLENQQIPTGQTSYLLDEQIRQSIVALEPAWEKKDMEFDVDMDRVEFLGNEPMMRHVWDNLIGNAIKFSPQGGLIRIRLCQSNGRILFDISDNGPGLTEEAQKHLFDKFYQADSSHRQEGNGLGLALVKKILALADGEIYAENIEPTGTHFCVTLPDR